MQGSKYLKNIFRLGKMEKRAHKAHLQEKTTDVSPTLEPVIKEEDQEKPAIVVVEPVATAVVENPLIEEPIENQEPAVVEETIVPAVVEEKKGYWASWYHYFFHT